MKQILLLAGLALLLPMAVQAQDAPKVEVFGGYSYLRADADDDGINLHGWNASIAGNVNKWLGVAADFSGHYGSPFDVDVQNYLFLIGPRVSFRQNATVTPFVHALFGAAYSRASVRVGGTKITDTDSAFAMIAGGGLDLKLHPNLAVRLFQADYVLTRFADDTQNNFRLSTGLVIRLGNR